jgi:fatty-acyl-CoA synthase
MSAAPVVLRSLSEQAEQDSFIMNHSVMIATGGAPPPSTVIAKMESLGFFITHLYGLTESFGPALVCERQAEWDALSDSERSTRLARQGVRLITGSEVAVLDPERLEPLAWDGETVGEIMIRSNGLMAGYLNNKRATDKAFKGGWFHSGDLAVTDADGFIRITDRAKDVIISGGENISSIEVEEVLYSHPSVSEAAVVGMHHAKWGETPCAFVALRCSSNDLSEEALRSWCRERLASFKVPSKFVFGPLPKTATGKIQKYQLRDRAKGYVVDVS